MAVPHACQAVLPCPQGRREHLGQGLEAKLLGKAGGMAATAPSSHQIHGPLQPSAEVERDNCSSDSSGCEGAVRKLGNTNVGDPEEAVLGPCGRALVLGTMSKSNPKH